MGLEILEKCEYICALLCGGKWVYARFDLKGRKTTKRRSSMDIFDVPKQNRPQNAMPLKANTQARSAACVFVKLITGAPRSGSAKSPAQTRAEPPPPGTAPRPARRPPAAWRAASGPAPTLSRPPRTNAAAAGAPRAAAVAAAAATFAAAAFARCCSGSRRPQPPPLPAFPPGWFYPWQPCHYLRCRLSFWESRSQFLSRRCRLPALCGRQKRQRCTPRTWGCGGSAFSSFSSRHAA